MYYANACLNLGGSVREPGQAVPEAHEWSGRILKIHLERRSVVDTDPETAAEIRRRFLANKAADDAKLASKMIMRQRARVEAAKQNLGTLKNNHAQLVEDLARETAALEAMEAVASAPAPAEDLGPHAGDSDLVDMKDLADMTAGELRDLCTANGLAMRGSKGDMIARLQAAAPEGEPEGDEEGDLDIELEADEGAPEE